MAENNKQLKKAREGIPSRRSPGACLGRQELADLVNEWIYRHRGKVTAVDNNYIGKLERAVIHWPDEPYRAALRAILGAASDAQLGLYDTRRSPRDVGAAEVERFLNSAEPVGAAFSAVPAREPRGGPAGKHQFDGGGSPGLDRRLHDEVDVVQIWTGREARLLRVALRISQREFAAKLGYHHNAVSGWERRGEKARLRSQTQRDLDTTFQRADGDTKQRFTIALQQSRPVVGTVPPIASAEIDGGLAGRRRGRSVRGAYLDPLGERLGGRLGQLEGVVAADDLPANLEDQPLLYAFAVDQGATTDRRQILTTALGLSIGTVAGRPALSTSVTDNLVDLYEAVTDVYRHADYEAGACGIDASLHHHLVAMLKLQDRARSRGVERRMLGAIADAAQLAGWFAIDQQDYTQAQRYCHLALSVARRAGDRVMETYILGEISYIYLHARDGNGALDVLEMANDRAGRSVPPAVRSWISEATGEAYAFAGNAPAGLRVLHAAEATFDGARPDNTPPWLAFYNDECHVARRKGRCLMYLGHEEASIETLNASLAALPSTFVRERSGTQIDVAFAYLSCDPPEIEEACRVASDAASLATQTGSGRNLRRLHELLVELQPHSSSPPVQSLQRQLLLA